MARRHQDERAAIERALAQRDEDDEQDRLETWATWHDVMCYGDGSCCDRVADDYEWSGPR